MKKVSKRIISHLEHAEKILGSYFSRTKEGRLARQQLTKKDKKVKEAWGLVSEALDNLLSHLFGTLLFDNLTVTKRQDTIAVCGSAYIVCDKQDGRIKLSMKIV